MEINNYYKTLSPKQKEKLKERTAFSVYYEWLDQLEAVKLTYEQRGIIFTAIGFYARTNGTEKLPADLAERIESEPLLLFIFNTFMNTTERATRQWINLRGTTKKKDKEEMPANAPKMPLNGTKEGKEGKDTIKEQNGIERATEGKESTPPIEDYIGNIDKKAGEIFGECGSYRFNPTDQVFTDIDFYINSGVKMRLNEAGYLLKIWSEEEEEPEQETRNPEPPEEEYAF